jgi:DNA-binding SARP family transcriptional activator/tetratricopeptide (TPR) repeat protein
MPSSVIALRSARRPTVEDAAEGPLELTLFGTLAARRDGQPLALRLPQHAVRLLAYLLLNRDRMQTREHVAFTLFPDDDEADARANVRRKLHLLQRALPKSRDPWIVTTATSVGWNPNAPCRLDIAEFERLSASDETLVEADALYGGDLLVDLYDDWIVRERDRLRTLAMNNLLTLVAQAQKRRDYPAAIRYAQRLRVLDPWREDAVRALIALRYEAGDRAGALTEYERFRAGVAAEMGVEPMPETVCVYERVLAQAETSPASAAPGADRSGATEGSARRAPGLPFVSRAREYGALTAAWTAASNGDGRSLLVAGEAGIGKTRLIAEFAAFADSNGARVLRGGTTPFELMPYQPFSEALRNALPILRETPIEPLWLAVLATLVPQLHVAFPNLRGLIALDAEPERTRLFEAFEVAVGALAARRPMVLILEDLHWAGSATIGLFEYLARHAPQHRLLIVASYREEEVSRTHPLRALRRHLERERLVSVVALGPLDTAAIGEIVGQLADDDPTQRSAIATYLQAASDGNPFFLGEVIANDREAGYLDDAARRWHRPPTSNEPPRSLTSTLVARLERLPARVRSVAEIAAVIGRAFSAELVREVSGVDERSTLDSIGELIDRRLVREVDAVGTDFAFSHQLIQQTVYAQMPSDARIRRHGRVGSVIEDIYGEQIEQYAAEIAAHFDSGCEPEHAAEYYRLAARQALTLYASEEARTLAARGRQLAGDDLTRFRTIEIIEEAARRLGEREAQQQSIAQLLALARDIGDPELRREALLRQIRLAHDRAEREQERKAIDELATRMAGARAPWPAIFAQLKGSYLTAVDSYREARAVMSDALRDLSPQDYPGIYVDCRCALAELACFEGRVADVRAFLDDVPSFEREYDAARVVRLLETACGAANNIQDNVALAACAEQLLRCSRAIGYREGEATAYRYAGRAAWQLFEIDRARDCYGRALEMFSSMGQRFKQVLVLIGIANMNNYLGQFDEALEQFATADALAKSISYGYGHLACVNNISYSLYLKGDFDLALAAARQALELADVVQAPSMRGHALVNLGVAERELHDIEAAIVHLEEGTTLERQLNETVALGEDLCELIIALLRQNRNERAAVFAAEVLALAEDPARRFPHRQYLLWTAAAVRHAAGDDAGARALLERARSILDSLEATISDATSRIKFRNLRYNRAIDDAFDRAHWQI